jgi:hypothetical protein
MNSQYSPRGTVNAFQYPNLLSSFRNLIDPQEFPHLVSPKALGE